MASRGCQPAANGSEEAYWGASNRAKQQHIGDWRELIADHSCQRQLFLLPSSSVCLGPAIQSSFVTWPPQLWIEFSVFVVVVSQTWTDTRRKYRMAPVGVTGTCIVYTLLYSSFKTELNLFLRGVHRLRVESKTMGVRIRARHFAVFYMCVYGISSSCSSHRQLY